MNKWISHVDCMIIAIEVFAVAYWAIFQVFF